jgi:hypothetical protein
MPDENFVFQKTQRGADEIAAGERTLASKLRRALILVDGAKSVADLAPAFRPGEIDAILAELLSGGFIEPAGGAAAAAMPQGQDAGDARGDQAAMPAQHFEEVRRRAAREISDRLGPNGDSLALMIEGCSTPERLRVALREVEKILTSYLGADYGKTFAQKIGRDLV